MILILYKAQTSEHILQAFSIYIVDAVLAFAYAASSLYRNPDFRTVEAEQLSCVAGRPWKHGDTMLQYLKNASFTSRSGCQLFQTKNKNNIQKHPLWPWDFLPSFDHLVTAPWSGAPWWWSTAATSQEEHAQARCLAFWRSLLSRAFCCEFQAKGPGVSSFIQFNQNASPRNPRWDIVNLQRDGWKQVSTMLLLLSVFLSLRQYFCAHCCVTFSQVGFWTPQGSLMLPGADDIQFMGGQEVVADYVSALAGKHIRVVTILEKPFVMLKTENYDPMNLSPETDIEGIYDHSARTREPNFQTQRIVLQSLTFCVWMVFDTLFFSLFRNKRHSLNVSGFCIDILKELAKVIGFNYTIYLVPDGNFGTKDPVTYQWNGMVKELVHRVGFIFVLFSPFLTTSTLMLPFRKGYLLSS